MTPSMSHPFLILRLLTSLTFFLWVWLGSQFLTPIGTGQIASPNTLPSTALKGVTPPLDNERFSIPSNSASFGGDLEALTLREGGKLSDGDPALGNDRRVEDEREIDSCEGEQDLSAIPAHATSIPKIEISLMAVMPGVETMAPLLYLNYIP